MRGNLAGILRGKRRRGQVGELAGHFGAQRVGHSLAEHFKQGFLRGGKHAFQRETAKVQQRRGEGQRQAARQRVDDARQQKRRQQGREHARDGAQDGPGAQKPVRRGRFADGGKYAGFAITLHGLHLPSGFRRGRDTREWTRTALRAFPWSPCRPPCR